MTKNVLVPCVLAIGLLAVGAHATPVVKCNWTGTNNQTYDTASMWNPVGIPNAAYDNVIVNDGSPVANQANINMPLSGTFTIGQFNVLGTSSVRIPTGSTATINVVNTDNLGGDVIVLSGVGTTASSSTWNVWGNWRLSTANGAFDMSVQQLNLRGTNKQVFKGSTDGYTINTDVYGSYANDPTSSTDLRTYRFQNLKVKSTGTINGGFWVVRTLQVEAGGQLTNNVANPTDFLFFGRSNSTAANNDNTNFSTGYAGGKLTLPGGSNVAFPRNLALSTGFSFNSSGNPLYVWKMADAAHSINVGDLTVNGNFWLGRPNIGPSSTGGPTDGASPGVGVSSYYIAAFNPVDNDATATPRNAHILGNLQIGGPSLTHRGMLYIDDTNTTSIIDVDGTVDVGNISNGSVARTGAQAFCTGSVHLGGGTVKVGGDWRVFRSANRLTTEFLYQNWNAGTSTVLFDGNGAVKTQTIYSDNMPLYNLVVHAPVGGTVARSTFARDDLYLRGSLRLEQGIFNDQDRPITFNGPNHTLFWDNSTCKVVGNSLDNIILLAGAVVTLDTGLQANHIMLVDNILLGSGSKLYLNGDTLKSNGKTWADATTLNTGVPYEGGTIYGSQVAPEPATLLLLGTGAMGAIAWMRRRRMK